MKQKNPGGSATTPAAMIVWRGPSPEPTPEVPGADEVLPSLRFGFESGNTCDVTPSVKWIGGGECRISIRFAWERHPSAQELEAVRREMEEAYGFGKPVFVSASDHEETSNAKTQAWLEHGNRPQ